MKLNDMIHTMDGLKDPGYSNYRICLPTYIHLRSTLSLHRQCFRWCEENIIKIQLKLIKYQLRCGGVEEDDENTPNPQHFDFNPLQPLMFPPALNLMLCL